MPNGMEIARRKMRGQWSNGMLCSGAEIGMGDDHEGIMLLDEGLALGGFRWPRRWAFSPTCCSTWR